MSRVSTMHPQLVPVPVPDRVAQMIGTAIPLDILQAEVDADAEAREIGRFRPLASDDDRADREAALARLARHNKTLAAYNPGLIVRGAA